jgi:hypothetical protein
MARPKVFARLIKTTNATDVQRRESYYAYPFSKEHEPEHREQTVLATRSWHDPASKSSQIKNELSWIEVATILWSPSLFFPTIIDSSKVEWILAR